MGFITIRICSILVVITFLGLSCQNKKTKQYFGTVSSATPEASNVGAEIFRKGGNAVDVAIAVSFALGVTEPAMSGLGGGTQVLLSIKNGPPIAINGTTFSPSILPVITQDTLTYHRRSTIPSTVKVLDYLFKNYSSGNLTWGELIIPSIELAEHGFKVGAFRAKVYKKYEDRLLNSNHNTFYFLSQDGKIPTKGEIIKQPILAQTLRRLATNGADDFYAGKIAEDIANDMKENGGWITLQDLKNLEYPKELKPLFINYNNHRVYSQPPPCGGWTTLLIMNILKQKNIDELSLNDIIEAIHLAHEDRKNRPVTNLVDYDSLIRLKLDERYAIDLQLKDGSGITNNNYDNQSGETTHFSVVDAEGTAIAVTASINAYFGALAASNRLGFLYNTYMDDFNFEEEHHPFAVKPNTMAYSSMSPTIVQKNGENVLVIGSPGSGRIISTVAQITSKWITNGNLEELIGSNRVHASNNRLYLEERSDTVTLDKNLLKRYNLSLRIPDKQLIINYPLNPYFGGVHAIAKEHNHWIGVADPRRDGKAIKIE